MKKPKEVMTYNQAATALRCSPRNVRRVLKKHGVKPIVRGHRTVSFPADRIIRLAVTLFSQTNGRKHVNA